MIRAAILAALLAGPALAHEAPSGWTYDAVCCSNRDCQPIPDQWISEGAGGWSVVIPPGVHKNAPAGLTAFVPYANGRISGDEEYHACAVPGRLLCLYVPPGGV
jgi:hypothetical protein